jgi:hypothetical protein
MADINLEIALSIKEATDNLKRFTETAQKGFEETQKAASKLTSSVDDVAKNTSFSVQSLSTAVGVTLANAFYSAASSAVQFGKELISSSIDSALEAEASLNQLNTALKLSGEFTRENVDALEAQSKALEQATKFSDDQIISTQAQIQTLARLSGTALVDATQATVDFAAAMNIDLSTAAMMVGKAAEGNITSLQKYGIEVKKGATDSESFANVLRTLQDRFSGAAESSGNTFGGALSKMRNAIDNAHESLGNLIIQNPAVIEGVKQISTFVYGLITAFEKNSAVITGFINNGILVLAKVFEFAVRAIEYVIGAIDGFVESVYLAVDAVFMFYTTIAEKVVGSTNALAKFFGVSSQGFEQLSKDVTTYKDAAAAGFDQNIAKANEEIEARNKLFQEINTLASAGVDATIGAIGKEQEAKEAAFQSDLLRKDIRKVSDEQ